MRSVIRPSTPRSSSASISSGSSTVQTWTWRPTAWARRTSQREATTRGPRRLGTCRADGAARVTLRASPAGRATYAASSPGEAAVGTRGPARRRKRRILRPEKDATSTRSWSVVVVHEPRERGDGGIRLEVDVEALLGERRHQRGECGHRLATPHADLRQRGGLDARDRAGPVGDALEQGVVEGDEHTVARQVHVRLEVGVAERDGVGEGRRRVLEPDQVGVGRATAVGEREHRSAVVQEREPGAHGSSIAGCRAAMDSRRGCRLAPAGGYRSRNVSIWAPSWLSRSARSS